MRITTNSLATLVHAVTLGIVFALGGCVVVPGAHISVDDAREMDELNSGAADLIPITQSLINEMQARKAWTVQVATYVDESNAREIQRALLAEGFNATARSMTINNMNHHGVYVGPQADKSSADAVKNLVDSRFGLESIVLDYAETNSDSNMAFTAQMENYSYLVGSGDILNITVWDHPELTIPQGGQRTPTEAGNVVHTDGTIFYPYVGNVSVTGKHVTEIRALITRGLSRYIEDPQVDVAVAAFRSQRVFVSGAVNAPNTLAVTDVPITLIDALNSAGGMATNADWRSVILTSTRAGVLTKEIIDLSALYQEQLLNHNRVLRSNDVLHVPRNDALKVFVMGDVITAGTQRIDRSGLTLAEALNNVGGINEASADARGIFVLRANDEASKMVDIYQLDASMGPMLILSTQFRLKPMDIVYVTSAPIARWNKVLRQLTGSLNAILLSTATARRNIN